ncbi:hypothetical protein D915_007289 [Fasciola hepatica]|uniref:Uncharacterized protein n=1 Tax=Fasciola hepatica TaxID=6192 RepID=A0A4E0R435_FASHE|nr:hypothetical protein D915_007289 [Fasciola hepatica]
MGYVSDRYGRRSVLLWIMLTEALRVSLAAFIVMFNLNQWTVLVPNIIEGVLCGGLICAISQICVCVVDLTEYGDKTKMEAKRLILLTLFDAVACFSLAAGKAIAGNTIYYHGFAISAMISLILFVPGVIAVYWLPETREYLMTWKGESKPDELADPEEDTMNVSNTNKNTTLSSHVCGTFRASVKELKKLLWTGNSASLTVIVILFLFSVSAIVDIQYLFLYLMGRPFCWNSAEVGLYCSLSDAVSAIFSLLVVLLVTFLGVSLRVRQPNTETNNTQSEDSREEQPCIPANRFSNRQLTKHQKTLIIFLVSGMVPVMLHKITMGVASFFPTPAATQILYVALALKVTRSLNIPVMRALLASGVDSGEQGRLFSLTALAERIGILISVSALPPIYAASVASVPATVFFITAAVLALAILLIGLLPALYSK